MDDYSKINACRICANTRLIEVLNLGTQTLTGLFPKSKSEKLAAGPLQLVKCDETGDSNACGLVQLGHTYDKNVMYGSGYGYHSGLNPSMVKHLHGLVKEITGLVNPKAGDLIIDIGSNDSTLLQGYPKGGPDLIGIDPTGTAFKKFYPAHIKLIPEFFSAGTVSKHFQNRKARIVTSIAMFYDLDSPMDFVQEVRSVLAEDGIWTLEQSYLPAMLEVDAYDTVCHEHLEYYGLRQIKWMADRSGMKIVAVGLNDANGGSFRVTLAKKDAPYPEAEESVRRLLEKEKVLAGKGPYIAFRERVEKHRTELLSFIAEAKESGKKILGYGASTKGNVILQYCGLTEKDIPSIGEVNEDKFGRFTPGSKIPIIPEEEAKAQKPDYLLVLPWHFKEFIIEKEKDFLSSGGKLFFPLPRIEVV